MLGDICLKGILGGLRSVIGSKACVDQMMELWRGSWRATGSSKVYDNCKGHQERKRNGAVRRGERRSEEVREVA